MNKHLFSLICFWILVFSPAAGQAQDFFGPLSPSVQYLQKLSANGSLKLNKENLSPLVDFVLESPKTKSPLPDLGGKSGAFFKFEIPAGLSRVIRYGYSPKMPSYIFRPSCVRYTQWKKIRSNEKGEKLPVLWNKTDKISGEPLLIQGVEYEEITPDKFSGGYYGYNQNRTLALFRSGNSTVFISACLQDKKSSVGKKGEVLGKDEDWNYFYTGEKGITKTGLGWVDSYVYSAFTVSVYVQKESGEGCVCACFNWMDAGWMGMDFVKSKHVLDGLKRFATAAKTVLSSPDLPAAPKILQLKKSLRNCPQKELDKIYQTLLEKKCSRKEGKLLSQYCPRIKKGEFTKKVQRRYKESRVGLFFLKKWLKKETPQIDLSGYHCLPEAK